MRHHFESFYDFVAEAYHQKGGERERASEEQRERQRERIASHGVVAHIESNFGYLYIRWSISGKAKITFLQLDF